MNTLDATIAGVAAAVGMGMMKFSFIFVGWYLGRHPPNVARPGLYFFSFVLMIAALGFFVLGAGVGILFSALHPEKEGLVNVIFGLVAIATVAGIWAGLYYLEKAKELPPEEERSL